MNKNDKEKSRLLKDIKRILYDADKNNDAEDNKIFHAYRNLKALYEDREND